MAKISVRILKEQDLSIVLIRGEVTLDDLETMRASSSRPTSDIVIVYQNLDGQRVAADELRQFAMAVVSDGAIGRTAFVVSSDLEFGLTRVFDAYTDTTNNQVQRRLVRSLADAASWLGVELSGLSDVVTELEREGDE